MACLKPAGPFKIELYFFSNFFIRLTITIARMVDYNYNKQH